MKHLRDILILAGNLGNATRGFPVSCGAERLANEQLENDFIAIICDN